MSLPPPVPNSSYSSLPPPPRRNIAWLDTLALLAWGVLLLKYCWTGQYKLLINPIYFGLVLASGILLLLLGVIKGILIWRGNSVVQANSEHITLFPTGWGTGLLLVVAIAGLLIPPNVLTSQTALKRGVTETLPLTRSQPQAFRTTTRPEERSLLDWMRTLNAYPEPDAYEGQPAKVTGFVVPTSELPDNYLLLSRFVITCCAVDAYPVGIPVKLETSGSAYPRDTWLEVSGTMRTETLPDKTGTATQSEKRRLVIVAHKLQIIPTPADPYEY